MSFNYLILLTYMSTSKTTTTKTSKITSLLKDDMAQQLNATSQAVKPVITADRYHVELLANKNKRYSYNGKVIDCVLATKLVFEQTPRQAKRDIYDVKKRHISYASQPWSNEQMTDKNGNKYKICYAKTSERLQVCRHDDKRNGLSLDEVFAINDYAEIVKKLS